MAWALVKSNQIFVAFSEYLNLILNECLMKKQVDEIKISPSERISTLCVRFCAFFFWTRHLYRCAYKLMCDLSRFVMYRCDGNFTSVKLSLKNTFAIPRISLFFGNYSRLLIIKITDHPNITRWPKKFNKNLPAFWKLLSSGKWIERISGF